MVKAFAKCVDLLYSANSAKALEKLDEVGISDLYSQPQILLREESERNRSSKASVVDMLYTAFAINARAIRSTTRPDRAVKRIDKSLDFDNFENFEELLLFC